MILINLLRAYWKPLLAFLILASLYGYIHVIRSDNASLKADIVARDVTAKAQEERNKIVIKQQEKITADVVQSYSDSITKLKDYYAKNPTIKFKSVRVFDSATSSGEVSSIPDTTKPIDADSEGITISADSVTTLDCASDVLQLLTLQDWIKQQVNVQ